MTGRRIAGAAVLSALLSGAASAAAAETLAVLLDGSFREWRRLDPAATDAADDAAAGALDLGRLWLADDGEALYLRLEVGRETLLQKPVGEAAGSGLRLLLDLDGSTATGAPLEGLGVDLEARFGERQVLEYDAAGRARAINGGAAGVVGLPTHSAEQFEIRVPLPAAAGPLSLVLQEEVAAGDRLPDSGAVTYEPGGRPAAPVRPITLDRKRRTDLRLLSLNVEESLIVTRQAVYRRLLRAISPDVVCFQSLRDWDAETTRRFVQRVLPPPAGRRWEAQAVRDVTTVSSFPILAGAAVDGNLVVRLDLSDEAGGRDLVLFNVHLPCCADDSGRDREADRLAATWRDLLAGSGPFAIAHGEAVVFAGDFNFVGYRRQLRAIRDGVFIDAANGPDFVPGRGEGSLRVAPLRHAYARTTVTWRRSASPFAPGRLDWVFYSGDALKHRKSLVLDVSEMPRAARRAAGLERRDTDRASDHLPLVVDFRVRG